MVYNMLIPSIPVIIGYLSTYALYKRGFIHKIIHMSVWNFIILVAFLISGGTGLILVILQELGMKIPISIQLLYWNVEFGITLSVVTVFHLHIHWKSFKAMFQANGRSNT